MQRRRLVAVAVLLAAVAGCTVASKDPLPPVVVGELAPLYEEELAELGVELTGRGGLIDASDGYETSPNGTHLALYVAPLEDQDDDAYVQGLTEITALFAADVFERWPGLETFDVCQEKFSRDEELPIGQTLTQVNLTREAAAGVGWDEVTLEGLMQAADADEDSYVRVIGQLRDHPTLRAAREAVARTDT